MPHASLQNLPRAGLVLKNWNAIHGLFLRVCPRCCFPSRPSCACETIDFRGFQEKVSRGDSPRRRNGETKWHLWHRWWSERNLRRRQRDVFLSPLVICNVIYILNPLMIRSGSNVTSRLHQSKCFLLYCNYLKSVSNLYIFCLDWKIIANSVHVKNCCTLI